MTHPWAERLVMADERIIFNGIQVVPEWPARIEAAQHITEYEIEGFAYERIKYGNELDPWPPGPCHDCAVLRGQYHVPGCDVERCPRCQGQAIGCDCTDEDADQVPLSGPES